jgi:hypothetical protein
MTAPRLRTESMSDNATIIGHQLTTGHRWTLAHNGCRWSLRHEDHFVYAGPVNLCRGVARRHGVTWRKR